ncbi:DUF2924 domain-containing protein [Fimbriiglobus ruber]|uniref:Putative bacteriophage-related protein n=1 Tax=Fimbriiglobus ruber TaxID=1908690 RepID=A0A225DMU0_9BACT|nr:DUF2924 domain-containing protein [Fimbriiglobus ruber]OWK39868.1 putative bacteriophage-related protein [Fimbriiglobus ruber]
MSQDIGRAIAALPRMTVKQLRAKYAEVFGEATNGHNKAWLVKRIAWRLQAKTQGGLSDRAKKRAAELADDADLRVTAPKVPTAKESPPVAREVGFAADERLPPPGTIITRPYKSRTLHVRVLATGFEHDGIVYTSLSAVAKAITGSHCNGFRFFRLVAKDGAE